MSLKNGNTGRLERKMHKCRMPLVASVLFHRVTASMLILDECDRAIYTKSQCMVRKTNTLGFSCEKLEAFNQQN